MDEQNPISDDYLIQAARRRLLRMLEKEGGDAASIVNNVYGGGGSGGGAAGGGGGGGLGGMLEAMGGGGEDPFDYFVDIKREDLPDINPATGKPLGWKKTVHRFRSPTTPRGSYGKKKDPMTYHPVDPMDPGAP